MRQAFYHLRWPVEISGVLENITVERDCIYVRKNRAFFLAAVKQKAESRKVKAR